MLSAITVNLESIYLMLPLGCRDIVRPIILCRLGSEPTYVSRLAVEPHRVGLG
jgi:hypothetical protein